MPIARKNMNCVCVCYGACTFSVSMRERTPGQLGYLHDIFARRFSFFEYEGLIFYSTFSSANSHMPIEDIVFGFVRSSLRTVTTHVEIENIQCNNRHRFIE